MTINKKQYEILEDEDKKFVKNFLNETGCELLFDGK